MFHKIKNPVHFQGNMLKKNYFEGWYYKLVSADGLYSVAFIPGIILNNEHAHAFIQVFVSYNNSTLKTIYAEFDKSEFISNDKPFAVDIQSNRFTEHDINVCIASNNLNIEGKIAFSNNTKIRTSWLSPSIMGFFGYFTFMECYHGIVSMHHTLQGQLTIDGKIIDFDGGKGYIEKDWGSSFPSKYVWMQSNHFANKQTSFMFSEAIIPFKIFFFNGLIINLIIDGKEYRFATYNGAKVTKKHIAEKNVHYEITRKNYKLVVEAVNDKTTSLPSPKNGVMNQSIKEGLSGVIKLQLYEKNKLMYDDIGTHAGLEIMW